MPEVMVWSSPKGLPMAKTFWPTWRVSDSPIAIGCNSRRGALICNTARSLSGAAPTSEASHFDWSAMVTSMELASLITWKFVTILPLLSQTMPEPVPWGISTAFKENRFLRTALLVIKTTEFEVALKMSMVFFSSSAKSPRAVTTRGSTFSGGLLEKGLKSRTIPRTIITRSAKGDTLPEW